ncbi:hypothetical protein ASD11_14350 [Aeromicrobium sp. Root495]|uniref:MlaD family protein n=1 Tax=Aeromicrobium sp. Root495 TaxID=1736550 RepID=UPI0006F7F33B|nr:MlaD family protein [Aeromicrobium sp. Root495]KQY55692.1 hypothetical protein ASD11_14350 [Aeromicrobium sp. Root495]
MVNHVVRRIRAVPPRHIGLIMLATVLLLGVALFQKQKISTVARPGEVVTAKFTGDYRLRDYVTKVKIAGVSVGVVTKVSSTDDGHALVKMKVDGGTREILRSSPTAAIRPATLLGGNYYVDLVPRGERRPLDHTIAAKNTTLPVELDRVADALTPTVRSSIQNTTRDLARTLDADGQREVKQLLRDAPDVLQDGTPVVAALRGNNPDQDLTRLVSDLETAASVMTAKRGELDASLRSLSQVSGVLGRQGDDVARAVGDLPTTLRTTRTGLDALSSTLGEVRSTADDARPAVKQLDPLFEHLEPALREAAPLLQDLPATLADLEPVVRQLVPTATTATDVLGDVEGSPLDRLNGPVMDTVLSPWKGEKGGPYETSGNSTPFYKELAYMFAGLNDSAKETDSNGATLGFQPGIGVGSLSGLPISLEKVIGGILYPNGSGR